MSDTQNMVKQANCIIHNKKKNCVETMQACFPNAQLNQEMLVQGTWSNIAAMAYKLFADFRKKSGKAEDGQATAYATQMAFSLWGVDDWYFGKDKGLHNFCKGIFEPAIKYVDHMMINVEYPDVRGYKILPNRSKFNNGLPASLQYIAPHIMELCAVSENSDAHQINDILWRVGYLGAGYGLVAIKMVPELPNLALEYATRNNIKVY